ncbi:hypothetical protein HD806DRAFT_479557 [Xylariaceae sp. AK1471]|nr:hypothetical protein HD806DRAFT_479557 [Xylariaceae sp. AK1471]
MDWYECKKVFIGGIVMAVLHIIIAALVSEFGNNLSSHHVKTSMRVVISNTQNNQKNQQYFLPKIGLFGLVSISGLGLLLEPRGLV